MLAKDTKGWEEGVGAYLLMNSKERVNGWMVNTIVLVSDRIVLELCAKKLSRQIKQ